MKTINKLAFSVKLHFLAIGLYLHDVLFYSMAKQGLIKGANSLTNLIPSLYSSLDVVSRELVGAIPCASLDATTARAAVGQEVHSFYTPSVSATDVVAGVNPPDDGEQEIGNKTLKITKVRRVPFRWNGEQTLGLNNGGPGVRAIQNDQITQAMRTLVNEMEADLVREARLNASRAWGTAGTTPFASDLSDPAQLRKILDDNGAPPSDRALIMDTTAGARLRTLGQLTKANEAGSVMTLRDGQLLDLHGMSLHESAGVRQTSKGTAADYVTNTDGYSEGDTEITVTTGTGKFNAGDIVTFAGDSNKYVVAKDLTGPGVLEIAAPGLRRDIPGSATAVTLGGDFTGNVAFARSALVLATRTPALPDGGDSAVDRVQVTDPRSGITFEISMYAEYRRMQYEISAAWGVRGIKPEHTALLLG